MKKLILLITCILAQFKTLASLEVYVKESTKKNVTTLIPYNKQTDMPLGLCTYENQPDKITLGYLRINTGYRKQQIGSLLLNKVLETARSVQRPIHAEVSPLAETTSGKTDKELLNDLLRFYTRHGAEIVELREHEADIVFNKHLLQENTDEF